MFSPPKSLQDSHHLPIHSTLCSLPLPQNKKTNKPETHKHTQTPKPKPKQIKRSIR